MKLQSNYSRMCYIQNHKVVMELSQYYAHASSSMNIYSTQQVYKAKKQYYSLGSGIIRTAPDYISAVVSES